MTPKRAFIFIAVFLGILLFLSAIITLFHNGGGMTDKVALVRVEGPLIDSKSAVEELNGYRKDPSVKAIVLRVNSPGGGVVAAQEIHDEVKRAAAQKNVVVSMGALAASGGYYISAPATRIFANPGTVTGSIGVIMEVPNVKGLMEKLGIRSEVVTSGRHKDLASPMRGIGVEERAILQGVMDDIHRQFIKAVANGRKMPVPDVTELADGRIFSGVQAKKLGLVDELGDLEAAIKKAAALSGIKGDPEIVTKKEKNPLMELFKGKVPDMLFRLVPSAEMKYQYQP